MENLTLNLKQIDVEIDRKATRRRHSLIDGRNRKRELIGRQASLIAGRTTKANASENGEDCEGKAAGHHGSRTTGDCEDRSSYGHVRA